MRASRHFSPRSVLIPLANLGGRDGRVARIVAGGVRTAYHAAGLNPHITDLHDWNLYEAGSNALGVVKNFVLPTESLLGRLRIRPLTAHISVTNGPEILGLDRHNAKSAELGIALAALMYETQSAAKMAIATGSLAQNALPDGDIAILPIAYIDQKIAALRDALERQKGGAFASSIVFILPDKTEAGEKTAEVYAAELGSLQAQFKAQGVALSFCFAGRLRTALAALGGRAMKAHPAEKFASRVIAGAGAAALCALGLLTFLNAPIKLSFAEIDIASGERLDSPLRGVFDVSLQKYVVEKVCLGPQRMPVLRNGDSLFIRVKAEADAVSRLLGYNFAVLTVSEHSPVRAFTSDMISLTPEAARLKSLNPNAQTELAGIIDITPPPERTTVFVLAQRWRHFDPGSLKREVEEVIADKPGADRINSAAAYLARRAPGYIDYYFVSTEDEPKCDQNRG